MGDDGRLRQLLGGPEFAWLIGRLRQRLERGGGVDGTITLRSPTPAQRDAVARLFGRPLAPDAAVAVRLQELDAVLRHAEVCDGVTDAVEQLSGPVEDRRARQRLVEDEWRRLFAEAERAIGTDSARRAWLDDVRASGVLSRLARGDVHVARTLLDQAFAVVGRLPARGVPLTELAAAVTGDSHALDPGEPLATLVIRFAARLAGVPAWDRAADRRDAWAGAGVLCDELSAPVLTLNLSGDAKTLTGRALALHAAAGEPYRLSTRQLLQEPGAFALAVSGRVIYICENPTVVAAAASRLGSRSAPLVCIEGQPKTAARVLLAQLAAAGARLRYHGDFDWGGIRIANIIMTRHGAEPWRYTAAAYRATAGGAPLRGVPVVASWDPALAPAMAEAGRAVYEEQVLGELVADLHASGPTGCVSGRSFPIST